MHRLVSLLDEVDDSRIDGLELEGRRFFNERSGSWEKGHRVAPEDAIGSHAGECFTVHISFHAYRSLLLSGAPHLEGARLRDAWNLLRPATVKQSLLEVSQGTEGSCMDW